MHLTDTQREHLFALMNSTQYQCKESYALAKKGLAIVGRSRFCDWVTITVKGEALVHELDPKYNERAAKREAKALEKLIDMPAPSLAVRGPCSCPREKARAPNTNDPARKSAQGENTRRETRQQRIEQCTVPRATTVALQRPNNSAVSPRQPAAKRGRSFKRKTK